MQLNNLQTNQLSTKLWKIVSNICHFQREIDRRRGSFSAWY